jgi:hypothetical protein
METGKKVPGIVQEGGRERQREWIKRRVRSSVGGKWGMAWVEMTVGVEINT